MVAWGNFLQQSVNSQPRPLAAGGGRAAAEFFRVVDRIVTEQRHADVGIAEAGDAEIRLRDDRPQADVARCLATTTDQIPTRHP